MTRHPDREPPPEHQGHQHDRAENPESGQARSVRLPHGCGLELLQRCVVVHQLDPARAAEHFYCLLKGMPHLRVLVGLCPLPTPAQREAQITEVVDLFLRAFAPGPAL